MLIREIDSLRLGAVYKNLMVPGTIKMTVYKVYKNLMVPGTKK